MSSKRKILFCLTLLAVVGANGAAHAQVNGWENLRRSNGNLRPDSYTAGRAVQGSQNGGTRGNHPGMASRQPRGGGHVGHGGHGAAHNYGHGHGYGNRSYYSPYYSPYYGSVYRYPTYYARPYYYVPPVVIPAGQLYGPGVMRRFMGGW